ncbi:F0F1 ATP synthase subunit B [Mangrovicella endophytica]|uniref:F0F1 ATP synthase subunit B n=1 Tax=Mangrovicella endophytica TaxID=2066697 RepID=UPI000C9E6B24|nr:F0F1 ATP synthase subunit B [Mangrovicella endophytica]
MFVTQAFAQAENAEGDAIHLPPSDEAAAAHGETVHVEGEHGVFPPFNSEFYASQVFWLAITFAIFYVVLKKTVLPRIGGIIENRRERIALDLEAAGRMKSEADAAQAAYEQELAEARAGSHKIAQDARDAAKADATRERASIEADLDARLEAAQARIGEIKRQALADVGTIAEEAAETILRDVAGLDVSRDDVARAVAAERV